MTADIQRINELKSYTEYNVSTPTSVFTIGFQYEYNVDHINVYVDGVEATAAGYTVQHDSQGTITLTPAVPTGVVRLQRETDIDTSAHTFSAGAKFTAGNMDENFQQIRHSQQEVRDGFSKLSTDTYEIIDTLQDVGQAAQDAADAAEQAAQTANDAAAQVNDKVSQVEIDYIHENGAALPYKDGIAYEENAVVVKDGVLQQLKAGSWGYIKHPASDILDISGKTQQEINNTVENNLRVLTDPLTREGVVGDGQYRNIADLWTVGTDSYRFNTQAEAESYLGFNIANMLVGVGLDSTVDTAYLQKYILDAYNHYLATGVVTTIKLRDSVCYLITGLQLYPFVNLISDGQTEFKKRPALSITTESTLKWWRIAMCRASAFATEEASKHRCILRGIKFNGNMLNMNWTYNTYNQEQGSSLMLYCVNGATKNIRAKFDLQDLVFVDSVSDGLHVVQNCDVIFNNLQAYNCFRGGLVVTGGNSVVVGDGMVANNSRMDFEIDSAGFGGSYYVYASLRNYFQDIGGNLGDFTGGCDIGGWSDSEFYFDNVHVHTAPTNIMVASGASISKAFHMLNSTFTFGVGGGEANRIINTCPNFKFQNTAFRFVGGGYIYMYPNFTSHTAMYDYIFKDCTFDVVDGSTPNWVFLVGSQLGTSSSRLVLDGGNSNVSALNFVYLSLGGRVLFNNLKHNCQNMVYRGFGSSRPTHITFNKIHKDNAPAGLTSAYANGAVSAYCTTEFTHECVLGSSQNINNTTTYGTVKNKRTIYSDTPPTATTQSFVNDRFILNTPEIGKPCEWVALTNSKTASNYRATKWLTGNFTTATLPVLTSFDVGCQNFDTTLNKLVTWSGTAWV